MQALTTWQGRPVREMAHDVCRDGYILVFDDRTSAFLDRWTVADMNVLPTFHRPQPLVTYATPPVPARVPERVQRLTQAIADYGWGGGAPRPRSRRTLTKRLWRPRR